MITLAELFNDYRFERAAEHVWHLKLITPREAACFLDEHRGPGLAASPGSVVGLTGPVCVLARVRAASRSPSSKRCDVRDFRSRRDSTLSGC